MAPAKKKIEKECCRKKEMITVEVKKEIIKKYEQGMKVAAIAKFYNRSSSTICTILKRKEELRWLDVAKGVTTISKQRPRILEDIEKFLLVWINETQLAGNVVTESLICEKAKALYADLSSISPCKSAENKEDFKASRGWFDNFKRRSGFHFPASSDTDTFITEFHILISSECYLPQQVFNCDETELFWKMIPKGACFAEDNYTGLHYKKDCITLLLCANASGNFKVRPLVVYSSESQPTFKTLNQKSNQTNVLLKTNMNARVTRVLFIEWVNEVFGPAVKNYLIENKLPLKTLLVLDNGFAHPPDLENKLLEEFKFIKVKFLPSSSTPLIQPMNQQVISNFKKLYIKVLFHQYHEATQETKLSLQEFYKRHFYFANCLEVISKAWEEVTQSILNTSWSKLWPECIKFPQEKEDLATDEIISLGENLGIEMDESDIHCLLEECNQALTTSDLMDLLREQQQVTEEESRETSICLNEISDMFEMWGTLQNFVEKHHPSKTVAVQTISMFNDSAMLYFCEILKKIPKQVSLDEFLIKIIKNKRVNR